MTSQLKPCPFCGGRDTISYMECPKAWSVSCGECHAVLVDIGKTEAEAIEAWNTRAPDTDLLHRIAEAMKERALEKMDECCEPCFQCHQNIRAIDTAALVKEVCDADAK